MGARLVLEVPLPVHEPAVQERALGAAIALVERAVHAGVIDALHHGREARPHRRNDGPSNEGRPHRACNLRILGVERVRVFQLGETVVVLDVGVVDEGDPGLRRDVEDVADAAEDVRRPVRRRAKGRRGRGSASNAPIRRGPDSGRRDRTRTAGLA